MSTGEDESSPGLNGRLRPRKSTNTAPNPQSRPSRKIDGKLAQDKPKRISTPSKASPSKQDDLTTKSDTSPAPLFLCPYCDRKFASKQTASKHARRIHLSTSKQDNFIKCLYCNHSEAESNDIIKHMVDNHPNQYFACLDCHTRFSVTTELAVHKHNVCEKQKPSYRSKLRQKASAGSRKNPKRSNADAESDFQNENTRCDDHGFNGIVISCELKPSQTHDEAADIEDNITTNLILPPTKGLSNAVMEKNAVIVLDDIQWNKRIPPNFSFHNTDADQILSRLGVVHRSPRVGETTKKEWIRIMDEPTQKFERCFDTNFYSKVAKNVQENLTKYLDGSFNFNPDKENTIKTRKSKTNVVINTAEGFPILLAYAQYSRNLLDGYMPRTMAPKHKWKWDNAESDKNVVMLHDDSKRDSHVNNCIITLVSSLDIWTQLRMRRKFDEIFKTTPTAKKTEKQNIISMELKEILESRDIPSTSTQIVKYEGKPAAPRGGSEIPAYLGLSPATPVCELQPAVLSGEWVRPRCYVCCACGEQTNDARALSAHISSQHPNAQVQHYEIVGETLLSADILKHLYVPPSQMSNRTRPPRGFRDCTKCKKSVTLEDLHQHMLDCAGDTPTVRRKCRYRPFGVRRRRPRLPDNTIRKKMRKDIRSRHRQKGHLRPRPRIRTEVGDAETIRKMIADLPAKRNRITPSNVLRPRRNILTVKKSVKIRPSEETKAAKVRTAKKITKFRKPVLPKKHVDADNSSNIDEDDQPLKSSAKHDSLKTILNNETTTGTAINRTENSQSDSKNQQNCDLELDNIHSERNVSNIDPNQLSMQQANQRIDIRNPGPSAVRQHSNRDGSNNQEGSDRQPAKQGNEGNEDNNLPSAPNVPLKHSIASLTFDAETHEQKSVSCEDSSLLPQDTNITPVVQADCHQTFENEAVTEKFDKPPLSIDSKDSSGSTCQQKDKLKLSKNRKGLDDCIAMLKYKKGLPLERMPKQSRGNQPANAAVLRVGSSMSGERNVNLARIQPSASSERYVNDQISAKRRSYSETRAQRELSNEVTLSFQTQNLNTPSRKSSVDTEFVTPKTKQAEAIIKEKSPRPRSMSRSEQDGFNPMFGFLPIDRPPWVQPLLNPNEYSDISAQMRRNSCDGGLNHDNLLYQSAMANPFAMNAPNLHSILPYSCSNLMNIEATNNMLSLYSQQIRPVMYEHNIRMANSIRDNLAQVAYSSHRHHQLNALHAISPQSKSTGNESNKQDSVLEQHLDHNHQRRTSVRTPVKHSAVSPSRYTEDLNKRLASSICQLPLTPSSGEVFPMSAPPAPRARRETFKRAIDDTDAHGKPNCDDGSQNKIFKKSQAPYAENTTIAHNLRRHSIEAHPKIGSHDSVLLQVQRGLYDKDQVNVLPISRGLSESRRLTPPDDTAKTFLENNKRANLSTGLLSRHSSNVLSANQESHGMLFDDPEIDRVDRVNKIKSIRDDEMLKMQMKNLEYYKNAELMAIHKQINNSSELNSDDFAKGYDAAQNIFASQDLKPKSNIQGNNSHNYGFQRESEEYLTHSASDQRQESFQTNTHQLNKTTDTLQKQSELNYSKTPSNNESVQITQDKPHSLEYSTDILTEPLQTQKVTQAPDISLTPHISSHYPEMHSKENYVQNKVPDQYLKSYHTRHGSFAKPTVNYSRVGYSETIDAPLDLSKSSVELRIKLHDVSMSNDEDTEEYLSDQSLPRSEYSREDLNDEYEDTRNIKLRDCRKATLPMTKSRETEESKNQYYKHRTQDIHQSTEEIVEVSKDKTETGGISLPNDVSVMEEKSSVDEISMKVLKEQTSNRKDNYQPLLSKDNTSTAGNNTFLDQSLHRPNLQYNPYGEVTASEINEPVIVNISSADGELSKSPEYNSVTSRPLQSTNVLSVRQENMHEKFQSPNIENNNLAQMTLAPVGRNETKTEFDERSNITNNVPSIQNTTDAQQVNIVSNIGGNMSIDSPKSYETCNEESLKNTDNDNLQTEILETNRFSEIVAQATKESSDQDPETARKFAMLPQELVKILDTIPKGHRTQLLDILPQYVKPPSIAAKQLLETSSETSDHVSPNTTGAVSQVENKQLKMHVQASTTTVVNDYNRLSVNTTFSQSSIVPKKRYSPAHGRLNSSEAYSAMPGLRPPNMAKLSQLSPVASDLNTINSEMSIQNDSSNEKDCDSFVLENFNEATTQRSSDKESDDNEINVVDVIELNVMSDNKDVPISVQNDSPTQSIPLQDAVSNPPAKSRNSNGQTANLRAVRIKASSARKPVPDDKNLLTIYSNQKKKSNNATNTGQEVNSVSCNNRSVTNLIYDQDNPSIKGNYRDHLKPQASISGNELADHFQNERKPVVDSETSHFNTLRNEDITSDSTFTAKPICSLNAKNSLSNLPKFVEISNSVVQNDDNISHKISQDKTTTNIQSLHKSPTSVDTSDGTNKDNDHFLGSMKSTAFTGGGGNEEIVQPELNENVCAFTFSDTIAMEEKMINATISPMPSCENNSSTVPIFASTPDQTRQNNKFALTKSTESNDIKENLSPDLIQMNTLNISHDESEKCLFSSSEPKSISLLLDSSIALSPKTTISDEDDSDDDVTLACMIKKRNSDQVKVTNSDSIAPKNNIKQSDLTLKSGNTVDNEQTISQKNKLSSYSGTTSPPNRLIGDLGNTSYRHESPEVNLKDEEKNDNFSIQTSKLFTTSTTVLDDKIIQDNSEFDVNKENNDNKNINITEHDDKLSVEQSQNESHARMQIDNCPEKNTIKDEQDTSKTCLDLKSGLDPRYKVIPTTKKIKHLKIVETTNDIETNKKSNSGKKRKSKPKMKNKKLNLPKCVSKSVKDTIQMESKNVKQSSDVDCNNKSSVMSANNLETLSINETCDSNLEKSLNQSSVNVPTVTPVDDLAGELKLCSEIREVNTVPLRRSRRGKSMYVDSSYGKDTDPVHSEDVDQKTPLTMKRLILSRVEKDKKKPEPYISDEDISAVGNQLSDQQLSNTGITDDSNVLKGKSTKRKKSLHSRRRSKKSKSVSKYQNDEESSDISNTCSNSDNNCSILRELPNAENKMEYIDTHKDDLKNHTRDNNVYEEKKYISDDDGLINVKQTSVAGKRRIQTSKTPELVSKKPKKTKYNYKNKSTSDFDSEDEKDLIAIKQNKTTLTTVENADIMVKDSVKVNEKEGTDCLEPGKHIERNNDIKQTGNTTIAGETRTTCYSRPIPNRRRRSSSTSKHDRANYDPYDIDLEDMVETPEPILKRKMKTVALTNKAKTSKGKQNRKNKNARAGKKIPSSKVVRAKIAANKYVPSNINSDSDSDVSDVPLQKYVEERALKSDKNNKINKTASIDNTKKSNLKDLQLNESEYTKQILDKTPNTSVHDEESNKVNSNSKPARMSSKSKKSTKRVTKDDTPSEDESSIDQNLNTNNNIIVDQTIQKPHNKDKNNRRTLAAYNNVDSNTEVDQQLRSDKFMENFGFYSERIPRKSNLLASKKISETFHMISNESDDSYFGYKETKTTKKSSHHENKKATDVSSDHSSSQGSGTLTSAKTSLADQSTVPQTNVDDVPIPNKQRNAKSPGSDEDSLTVRNSLENEEHSAPYLENDVISSPREAAEATGGENCIVNCHNTIALEANVQKVNQEESALCTNEEHSKTDNVESVKKPNKGKPNKPVIVKDKMYPDIEEIDMFEDKFDKIKRKSRSQAVAAKQVQNVVETNTSKKCRKPRTTKNAKKNYQSSQVPTKGALKGFDSIKISIPTQDLNMPSNVSPPRQRKKRRKVATKRRKETSFSESTDSESDDKEKSLPDKDVYEFKDSEDTELLELRPSTVMDRFRSMHNKNKLKQKEKAKGEAEKQREKTRDKERKSESKEKVLKDEKGKAKEKYSDTRDNKDKKHAAREAEYDIKMGAKETKNELGHDSKIKLKEISEKFDEGINVTWTPEVATDQDTEITRNENAQHNTSNRNEENSNNALASTSGFVPDRDDESDYESALSSPGGFLVYMSDEFNCACQSDIDSDDSDAEKGCDRPSCIYKNKDADKNAAIGNIFKNNAVRCDKNETQEVEEPKPDLDQLFDSLLDPKPSESSEDQKKNGILVKGSTAVAKNGETISKLDQPLFSYGQDDIIPSVTGRSSNAIYRATASPSKGFATTKNKNENGETNNDEAIESMCEETSDFSQDFTHASVSIQDLPNDVEYKKGEYVMISTKATQTDLTEIMGIVVPENNGHGDTSVEDTAKEILETECNSDDDFDMDKKESNDSIFFREQVCTASCSTQTDSPFYYDYDSVSSENESAITKFVRDLTPSQMADLKLYVIVASKTTQTYDPETHNEDDDDIEGETIIKRKIATRRFGIATSSNGMQTETTKNYKSSKRDVASDDNVATASSSKRSNRAVKKHSSTKGKSNSNNDSPKISNDQGATSTPETMLSVAGPSSRRTVDKRSPSRKSDEGISTSHDCSADAFEQASVEDTGVARQRARRKCTVGKQNVLAEHWSSESEADEVPTRPNSTDSAAATANRRRRAKKKEAPQGHGRRGNRQGSRTERCASNRHSASGRSGVDSDESEAGDASVAGPSRAPVGPSIRARPAHHYWSSDGEEAPGPQPQHGWIVGDSHKKLVTMLAHAKGRQNNTDNGRLFD